jgi:hypothetical protein
MAAARHEPAQHRFVTELDGGALALLEYREVGNGVLDYYRTYVPREHRGRGVAAGLVQFALDDARERGFKVRPTCPFVAKIIAGRPDYADLVDPVKKSTR